MELQEHCKVILTTDQQWSPYSDKFAQQEQPFNKTLAEIPFDPYIPIATYDFSGNCIVSATSSKDHHSSVSAETLAR